MSTRATNARHVRQRKLNTKQPLRLIRESDIDDAPDHEAQQQIPQVATGVEKGEEVEFHLQAVIKGSKQSYIPTPDTVKAEGIRYDRIYPKSFSQPATYIRFSSTVEDCVGRSYCMNDEDAKFLEQLNDGKDVNGQPLKDKAQQCSEDTFEEVMSFFEESSQRIQPFANLDSTPVLSLQEMEQAQEEPLSAEAQKFLKSVYQYWVSRKGSRPMMPTIKVRFLDTTSEADDADPYICFRRREVRQTRKTRGRDAQVVEKLKKLRLELEQARQLVAMVKQREDLNKVQLEINRKIFEERKQLKAVKSAKNIIGDKGEDEELLVNQKPAPRPKARPDGAQQRPATLRLRSVGERSAPDNDLSLLSDLQADAESFVIQAIDGRKEQHRRWNEHWQDKTWNPITPPPETAEQPLKWAPLFQEGMGYPTPPPSLPSRHSQDRDGDAEMVDQKPTIEAIEAPEPQFTFFFPPANATDAGFVGDGPPEMVKCRSNPSCRVRYGRGGRLHLELRKARRKGSLSRAVVSDAESDDDEVEYHPVPGAIRFDYRCAVNSRARPEGPASVERKQVSNGDQTAIMAGAQHQSGSAHSQQHATAGAPSSAEPNVAL